MEAAPPQEKLNKCLTPSMFGIYPSLGSEESSYVWLNAWRACRLVPHASSSEPERLTIEIDIAEGFISQRVSVEISEDNEKYRDTLLSRWMKAGAPLVPNATPEAMLALIVSQFPASTTPVWDNAFITRSQWNQLMAKASSMPSDQLTAKQIIQGLIFDTQYLSLVGANATPNDTLLGLEHALPDKLRHCASMIVAMMLDMHRNKGLLIVADTTKAQKAFDRVESAVSQAGWVVLCGDRPAENVAANTADALGIPVFYVDAQNLKRGNWIEHIHSTVVVGNESNLGVLRQRALTHHNEAASKR